MSEYKLFIIANPDEPNWRGITTPFWNQYRVGAQVEILIRRLLEARLPQAQVIVSLPYDYHDRRISELVAKYGIHVQKGPPDTEERERTIARQLAPHQAALFHRVEHPLVDRVLLQRLVAELSSSVTSEVVLSGFIPGMAPYRVLTSQHGERRQVELDQLDRWRFGAEVSDVEKVRCFAWLVETLRENVFSIGPEELGTFLRSNRYQALYFGLPLEVVFVERCDNCGQALEPGPCSDTLAMNSFVPQDVPYYWVCPHCGLVHLNPRPEESSIAALYNVDYALYRGNRSNLVNRWDWQELVDSLTERSGTLLDVGGGTGELRAFIPSGWRYGLCEINSSAAELARANGATFVHVGDLGALPHSARWDVIAMMQVIEHLPFSTFMSYIAAAKRLLRRNGRLYLSTPNAGSALTRTFGLSYAGMPYHLYLYTETSLRTIINQRFTNASLTVELGNAVGLPGWVSHWQGAALSQSLRRLAGQREWVLAQHDDCLFATLKF
ncbi:MAG: class I SAM-dependent methyltransferase [Clostridia bacterium]|nr:class I SAM-dependent methyltransferase [Clostridia bacterium]